MTIEHPSIESFESLDLVAQAERDYAVMLQHIIFFRQSSGPGADSYLRPDAISYFLRPNGTSYYLRP